jgi:1-deoxy-D-xylulose-5-phosphate synthase
VTAPKDGSEMLALLRLGTQREKGPFSLRWPRDSVPKRVPHISEIPDIEYGSWEILREGKDGAILAVGTMVLQAEMAAEALSAEGVEITVVNCRFLKPLDEAVLSKVLREHNRILTVEEGAVVNGFGAYLAGAVRDRDDAEHTRIRTLGIPDNFIAHGGRAELLREIDLDAVGIAENISAMIKADSTSTESPILESA